MESSEPKEKSSRFKKIILTGLTALTLGLIQNTNVPTNTETQNQTISQREVSGKIIDLEIPTTEEIKNARNNAQKFLSYNEEKIDPSLIIERVKGNYNNTVYLDKTGKRVLNLNFINPLLARNTLEQASKFNVNPKLMLTLALIESKFGTDKKQISSAGAKGPFQVMPKTIKQYQNKTKNPLIESPFLLIRDYAKILGIDVSYNSKLSTEEITLITAAYNAGMKNIKNKSEKIFLLPNWFLETKNYSLYALSALNHYNYDLGKDNNGNQIIV